MYATTSTTKIPTTMLFIHSPIHKVQFTITLQNSYINTSIQQHYYYKTQHFKLTPPLTRSEPINPS